MMRNTTPESMYRSRVKSVTATVLQYYRLVCLKVDISTFVRYLETNLWKIPTRHTSGIDVGVRGQVTCSSGVRYRI
jgi:transposase